MQFVQIRRSIMRQSGASPHFDGDAAARIDDAEADLIRHVVAGEDRHASAKRLFLQKCLDHVAFVAALRANLENFLSRQDLELGMIAHGALRNGAASRLQFRAKAIVESDRAGLALDDDAGVADDIRFYRANDPLEIGAYVAAPMQAPRCVAALQSMHAGHREPKRAEQSVDDGDVAA